MAAKRRISRKKRMRLKAFRVSPLRHGFTERGRRG
jgi:hypothetical protein